MTRHRNRPKRRHTERHQARERGAATRLGLSVADYLELRATQKHCPECDAWKVHADFGRDRSSGDGLAGRCKACRLQRREEAAE